MKAPPAIQRGDAVQITHAGKQVVGIVLLASANRQSLMLDFDDLVGGYLRYMPVLWVNDHYEDLIKRELVALTVI